MSASVRSSGQESFSPSRGGPSADCQYRASPLTELTVRISRSEFVKPGSPSWPGPAWIFGRVLLTCLPVSVNRHVSVSRYACLFTPSLQRVPWPPPPRWPCGSPPSTVLWAHTTALRPSPTPRFPLTPGTSAGCRFRSRRRRILLPAGQVRSGRVNHALVLSEETGALLCSWGTRWQRASGLRLRRPWRTLHLRFSRFCLPLG